MLLFQDFKICVKNNGYFSHFINKTRGVNQGCPASPGLCNLNGECIAHLLNAHTGVKGISIHDMNNILSQFADDTAVYTKYDKISIESICEVFHITEANIGLKISYEKTNMYRIGSLFKSDASLYTMQNLNWDKRTVADVRSYHSTRWATSRIKFYRNPR